MGTVERSHIEALLPHMGQLSEYYAYRSLRELKSMAQYMATSPAWTGPRPPRFLIWGEDLPRMPQTLPRPIPPEVLDQLDLLLEQAASGNESRSGTGSSLTNLLGCHSHSAPYRDAC